jgi:hypothetical protein
MARRWSIDEGELRSTRGVYLGHERDVPYLMQRSHASDPGFVYRDA